MTGPRAALACLALVAVAALAAVAAVGEADEEAAIKPLAARSLLLDVDAAGDRLVAVGERGHVLVSDDRGESWTQSPAPTRATLTAVHFHDARLGWAVGHDAVILRTGDGGASWELVHFAPDEDRPLLDIWFADATSGFAIGAYGFFLRTEDGGETWTDDAVSEDDFHLNHVAAAADGTLYIAAEAGFLYRSTDGGATWEELPSPYEGSFFGTIALDGQTVLAFGLRGHLFRSEDAGESWTEVETGTESLLTGAIRLGDAVVVGGLAGAVLVSDDAGRTFSARPLPDRSGLTALVDAGGTIVAVGENGSHRLPPP